jgi:hypothetical protein
MMQAMVEEMLEGLKSIKKSENVIKIKSENLVVFFL